ncbi:MAG: M15 family metallopeptidase [Acetivibrionales bacterium]|jgi:D-alanyl-D-alanine carboxypeptidase
MKKLSLIILSFCLLLLAVSCQKHALPSIAGAIEAGKEETQPVSELEVTGQNSITENQPIESESAQLDGSDKEALSTPEPDTSSNESDPTAAGPKDSSIQIQDQSGESITTPSAIQLPYTEPETDEDNAEYEILIPDEYKNLPCYYPEKAKRYFRYHELNPDLGYEKAILYVNIGLDKPFYSNTKIILEPDRIDVLVNKYNKTPDKFKPRLEELPPEICAEGVGKQYLRNDAKEAFIRMHMEAKEFGLNITAYGTYRSIRAQKDIWNSKVNSGRSIEDVDRLNARGGHSEHHTGLAVDVITNSYAVEGTKEFEWYRENAHKYGFIVRYPKGAEHITGYQYEPWHLRYLGESLAKDVYESGLTYEEYYAVYIEPGLRNKLN